MSPMPTVINMEEDINEKPLYHNGELRHGYKTDESKLSHWNVQDNSKVSHVEENFTCNPPSLIDNAGTSDYWLDLKENEDFEKNYNSSSDVHNVNEIVVECQNDVENNSIEGINADDYNVSQNVSDNENSKTDNFKKLAKNKSFRKRYKGNHKYKNDAPCKSYISNADSEYYVRGDDKCIVSSSDFPLQYTDSVDERDESLKEIKDHMEINSSAVKSVTFEDERILKEMPDYKDYKYNNHRSENYVKGNEPTCDNKITSKFADQNLSSENDSHVRCIELEFLDETGDHSEALEENMNEKILGNKSISIPVENNIKDITEQHSYSRGRGKRGRGQRGRGNFYNNYKRDFDYNSQHNRNAFNESGKNKWQKNQNSNADDKNDEMIEKDEIEKDKHKTVGPSPVIPKTNVNAYLFPGRDLNNGCNKQFGNNKNDYNAGNGKNNQFNNKQNNSNKQNHNSKQNNNNQNNNTKQNKNQGGNDNNQFEGYTKIILHIHNVFYSDGSFQPLDSFVVKLHYKFASAIFFLMFALIWHKFYKYQIVCVNSFYKANMVKEMITNICLSYSFLQVENGREYQLFYRWVPFSFLLLAVFFYFPKIIIKHFRNSRFTALLEDLHLNSFRNWKDDHGIHLDRTLIYMSENLGTHSSILSMFIFLHLLCLSVSGLSFLFIDFELQGRFVWLQEALYFPRDFEKFSDLLSVTFPPFVTCIINSPMKMQSERSETFNCYLPLMEYYEKSFMFIWFFLQTLIAIGVIKLSVIVLQFMPFLPFRCNVLKTKISSPNIRKVKKLLLQKLNIGDLFILYCIKKEINQYEFILLLEGIRIIIESQQGTNSLIGNQEIYGSSKEFLRHVKTELYNGAIALELNLDSSEKLL